MGKILQRGRELIQKLIFENCNNIIDIDVAIRKNGITGFIGKEKENIKKLSFDIDKYKITFWSNPFRVSLRLFSILDIETKEIIFADTISFIRSISQTEEGISIEYLDSENREQSFIFKKDKEA